MPARTYQQSAMLESAMLRNKSLASDALDKA
jgi:hypothetical protein